MPALRALLAVLWRERDLLDVLGDAYGSQRRAVAAGEGSARALAHRLATLLDDLQLAEIERAVVTKSLVNGFGADEYPTLTRLIELCPPSWAALLSEHRQALRATSDRVQLLARRSQFSVVDPEAMSEWVPPARPPLQRSLLDFLA